MIKSDFIKFLITSQKWKNLDVRDIEKKGKGVIATRHFQAGEVICDFHGKITALEGQQIRGVKGERGFRFHYISSNGEPLCIDASSCDCHPEKELFAHCFRHSSKCVNIRPRLYRYDNNGEEKEVILFIAIKDIKRDEELTFDYGNNKWAYRGEGLDLSWV